jgi:hypothetical protein
MTTFFVRDYLGQQPGQQGAAWSTSPDVVLAGAVPTQASQYTTPQGYATDYGAMIYINRANFIYPRALSLGGATTGRAWLFWAQSDLALWPQNWRSDQITVGGEAVNYQPITASADGAIAVVDQPFEWTPPSPAAGQHYISILWIEDTPANPPVNPVAGLPPFPTFDDLANFVLSHDNMGWRDSVAVNGQAPTWSQVIPITGPSPATPFYVGLQCKNMPTDGQVGFVVPGPSPSIPPVIMPMQPIRNPNMTFMVQVNDWPSGAQSAATLYYQQGATPPPPGASLSLVMAIPAADSTDSQAFTF